jgi:hypothetical protein
VGHLDIDRMIAESLDAAEEPRQRAGTRPLAHGRHILEQYVALCAEGECPGAEPSAEVALPVTSADPAPAPAPASTNRLSSILRRALGRAKR